MNKGKRVCTKLGTFMGKGDRPHAGQKEEEKDCAPSKDCPIHATPETTHPVCWGKGKEGRSQWATPMRKKREKKKKSLCYAVE